MPQTHQSPLRGLGFAFASFALFATHDALIKSLGATYAVFQIIFFAMLFAFVPMAVMMLADRQVDNFRPHHPWLILLRALMSLIAMSSAFYAFTVLPLAEVYALLFATPLLITALSSLLLGETVRLQRWAAVLVGLAGVMVVLRPGMTEFTLGHAGALTAAVASAFASIIVRRIGGEERTAVMILYPMLSSILVMGVILPFVYVPMALPDLGMVAGVGLLTVLAQLAIITAYRAAPAAVVAPVQYSQILWATGFGVLFFDELPDRMVALGAAIIIASGVFVVWRESRSNVSERNPVLRNPNPRFDAGPSPKPKHRRPS
ncbi:DMT family transporter [Aliiroseovarius subalbicans]|uniref:DMT family transporter n=1 Tax=Aliiroseovarius subalbicans TaxID=2925840 RepID=UPI001F590D22|nr:DMT family transporter [Aliiroseovarius subalbicans]MCI2399981.1 DMT family transporter [Aliiroseovarius subalbicans]